MKKIQKTAGHYGGGLLGRCFPPRICSSPVSPGPGFFLPLSLFSLLSILLALHVQGPLWLSDCEWNQLGGREVGLDLIIGDFGEM